jgi:hypothetical protein
MNDIREHLSNGSPHTGLSKNAPLASPLMHTASFVRERESLCVVINLTTAKALGIDVPMSLMVRADEMLD